MFERYTETARRVIYRARFFASEFGATFIEPGHILLGILEEQPDVFRPWLKSDDDYTSFRAEIEKWKQESERVSTSVDMPLSHPAKCVLAYAAEEAERQSNSQIRPSHLLTGLLREPGTAAAALLHKFGVELQQARLVFVASLKQQDNHRPETDDLHRLIDELPAALLGQARALLQALRRPGSRPDQG